VVNLVPRVGDHDVENTPIAWWWPDGSAHASAWVTEHSENETTLHRLRYGDWKFLFKTQDKWFNGIQENLATPLTSSEPVPH
jgi:hypothetical protein